MENKNVPQIPSVEEIEVELARLQHKKNRKHRKKKIQKQSEKEKKTVEIPTIEQVIAEREELKYRSRFRSVLASTVGILIVVAAVAALISTLYLPVLQISGSSMEPTLEDGDVIVLQKSTHFKTGELVGLYYNGKILLKRVIGQSGDYITMDADGDVFVNGEYVEEPYVTDKSLGDCNITFPYQVPDESCFVLGDHRSVSIDSRNKAVGCIKTDQIIGKVVVRIWPLDSLSLIR